MSDPLQWFPLLRSIDALATIDDATLRDVCGMVTPVPVPAGDVLVRQGEPGDTLLLVARGRLELRVSAGPGQPEVVVETVGPGRGIGLLQVLVGGSRTETAVAVEDCEVLRVERAEFRRYADAHPEALRKLTELVRGRLRFADLVAQLSRALGPPSATLRQLLSEEVEWVELRRGKALYKAGQPVDALFVLLSGQLTLSRYGTVGEMRHSIVGRGELLGQVAYLAGGTHFETATAHRDVLLAKIPVAHVPALLGDHSGSGQAMARALAERIARPLFQQTHHALDQQVIIPAHPGAPAEEFARTLVEELSAGGPTLLVDTAALARFGVIDAAGSLAADHPSWLRFTAFHDRVSQEYDYVIFIARPEEAGWLRVCAGLTDKLVFVCDATRDPEQTELPDLAGRRAMLLLMHPANTARPSGTQGWRKKKQVALHLHLRAGDRADVARVARMISGRVVTLTLGGGGARGLAHIGVVRALREAKIPIDYLGGTSMGAIISAQVALGLSYEEMMDLNRRIIAIKPFEEYTLPMVALLRSSRIEQAARMAFGDVMIEDLWLPWFGVAADLTTAEMVVMESGPVWLATRASGSLPGVAVPVPYQGRLLIDGGVIDNLPLGTMRQRIRGHHVVVDVSPPRDESFAIEAIPSPWKLLWARVTGRFPKPPPSIVDIMLRTTTLESGRRANEVYRQADLALLPPVADFGLLTFDRIDEIVETAYRYTCEQLAGWKPVS